MCRKLFWSALAVLALTVAAAPASAALLTLQPVVNSLLNPDSTPIDPLWITQYDAAHGVGVSDQAGPMLVNVDYYIKIDNLTGPPFQVGFGNVAFDILPQGLDPSPDHPRWRPDSTLVDTNGDEPDGEAVKWADNGDFGLSGSDFQSIVVGVAPLGFGEVGVDPRRTLAQAAPEYIGATQFLWTPAAGAVGRVDVDIEGYSTYTQQLLLQRRVGGPVSEGSLVFAQVEVQAGDTDRDGDVDLNDLNNIRNFFGETGAPVTGDTAPFDGVVDENDLNNVRNHFGESTALGFTAAPVPEPAAGSLAACFVALGLAGAAWRGRRQVR